MTLVFFLSRISNQTQADPGSLPAHLGARAPHGPWRRCCGVITLVTGPPCVGKSTYVSARAAASDLVVDLDAIAQRLGSPRSHNHHRAYLDEATAHVEVLLEQVACGVHANAWVIRSMPDAERIAELAEWLGADEVVHLLEPREVLVERAQLRPNPAATVRLIDWWLSKAGT